MRGTYLPLIGTLLLATHTANAGELAPPLAQCIHENAPAAEKTIASLTDATTFLVDDVCVVEAATEITRQQKLKLKEVQDRQKQKSECEGKAGGDLNARAACDKQDVDDGYSAISRLVPNSLIPPSKTLPEATAYAAKELMALRISHTKWGQIVRRIALAALFALSATPVFAIDPNAPEQCITGPVEKTYGGTTWLVVSCSDGKSLVFVAKEGGKAAPFEFDLTFTGNDYDLAGHGKGDRKFTDAAYADLQKLTGKDVLDLLNATKAAKPTKLN